jgi:hypothetical protein
MQIETFRPTPFRPIATHDMATDWRAAAIEAYRQAKHRDDAALHADLASRILSLTGHRIAPERIWSDGAARRASAAVEGVVFQLQAGVLMIVRPCVECGLGAFSSPPITSRADLGHALAEWAPACPHHLPADEDDDRSWSW